MLFPEKLEFNLAESEVDTYGLNNFSQFHVIVITYLLFIDHLFFFPLKTSNTIAELACGVLLVTVESGTGLRSKAKFAGSTQENNTKKKVVRKLQLTIFSFLPSSPKQGKPQLSVRVAKENQIYETVALSSSECTWYSIQISTDKFPYFPPTVKTFF